MPISRRKPRAPRRLGSALAAAGALALVLTGCVGSPAPSPSPTPSEAAPVFASDEEALAAAVEAYELYSAASKSVTDDGGVEPERVDPYVTESLATALHEEFAAFRESGVRSTGPLATDTESLVEWSQEGDSAAVSIYFCRDVSGVRVVDTAGKDVTPADREERVPSQAFLVSTSKEPETLIVDGIDRWSGDSFC